MNQCGLIFHHTSITNPCFVCCSTNHFEFGFSSFFFAYWWIFMTWELSVVGYCSKNRMLAVWENQWEAPRKQNEHINMAENTLAATESNLWNGFLTLELELAHVMLWKLNRSLFKGQKLVLSDGERRLEVQLTLMYWGYNVWKKSTSHLWDCLVGACRGNMHILRREVTDLRGVAEVTFHAGSLPCLLYHTRVRCVKSEVVSVGSAGNSRCKLVLLRFHDGALQSAFCPTISVTQVRKRPLWA